MNVRLAVPLETRTGAWITIMQGTKEPRKWGFAWRTPIMKASAFWYFDSWAEMVKARRRFIQDHGGRRYETAQQR
jgi:hypothetical protein